MENHLPNLHDHVPEVPCSSSEVYLFLICTLQYVQLLFGILTHLILDPTKPKCGCLKMMEGSFMFLMVFPCFPNVLPRLHPHHKKPLKSDLPSLRSGCRNHNFCRSWRMLTLTFTTKPRFWDFETIPTTLEDLVSLKPRKKKSTKKTRINPGMFFFFLPGFPGISWYI